MEAARTAPGTPEPLSRMEKGLFPSWLASTALHIGLLYWLSQYLVPIAPRGSGSEEFRTVGIYTRGEGSEAGQTGSDAAAESAADSVESTEAASGATSESNRMPIDDAPPIALDLPVASTPLIGPAGKSSSAVDSGNARDLLQGASTAGRGQGSAGSGDGRVVFFGKGQEGRRFVYVLDASGSMYEHNAIHVAKSELLASIAQIGEVQEFQIIFYNDQFYPMPTQGQHSDLFRGTESNRNLAAQHVRSVHPSGGTEHKLALQEALKLRPDVVFFLTDAGEPWMDAGDLEEIRKRNKGRCRICVVEFGKGARLGAGDEFWTKKLARDNGGTFAYHDIQSFSQPRK